MLSVLRNWNKKTITYSRSQGEPVLLEGLQKYYHKLGYSFIDIQDLQVTVGGSEAISMAFLATTEVGDEILTFEPFYTNYSSYAAVNGIKIVAVRTSAKDGFHLPPIKEIAYATRANEKGFTPVRRRWI